MTVELQEAEQLHKVQPQPVRASEPARPSLFSTVPVEPEDIQGYRALNSAAVLSLVLGVLSALALLDWWLAVLPAAGLLLGIYARRKIARHTNEYTGKGLATAGLILSVVFFTAGWSRLGYVYATEVPDGHQRISYEELQPNERVLGQLVPPSALELNGKRVFIKGYVYPGAKREGITQFLLVRDQGDCCFGGNPKLTDRVQVTLEDERGMTFSPRLFKVAGVFRVEPKSAVDNMGGVFYHLDEAVLR